MVGENWAERQRKLAAEGLLVLGKEAQAKIEFEAAKQAKREAYAAEMKAKAAASAEVQHSHNY